MPRPRKNKQVLELSESEDEVEQNNNTVSDDDDDEELGENEFIVEQILAEKVGPKGEIVFLTKWEGYPLSECTWQTTDSFVDKNLINQWRRDKHKIKPFDWKEWDRQKAKELAEKADTTNYQDVDSSEEESSSSDDEPTAAADFVIDKKSRRQQRDNLAGFVVDDNYIEYSDDDDLDMVDRDLSGKKDKGKRKPSPPRAGKRRSSVTKVVSSTNTKISKTKPGQSTALVRPVKAPKPKQRLKPAGKLAPSVFSKSSGPGPVAHGPARTAIPAKTPRNANQFYHTSSYQYRANRKFGREVAPDISKLNLSRPGKDPKPNILSPATSDGRNPSGVSASRRQNGGQDNEDVEMNDVSDGYNSLFEDDDDDQNTPNNPAPTETSQPQPNFTTTTNPTTAAPVDPGYTNTYAAVWDGPNQSPEPLDGKNTDLEWETDGFGREMTSRSLLVHFGNIAQRQNTYPELRYFTEDERVEIGTTKKKIDHILFWGTRMTRLGRISFSNVSDEFREFWSKYGEKGLWISKVISLKYAMKCHQEDFGEPQEWFDIDLENNDQWQPDVMASLRIANLNVAVILGGNWHILIYNGALSSINNRFGLPNGSAHVLRGLLWNIGWDMTNEALSREGELYYKNPPIYETLDEESEWVLRQEREIDLDEILGKRNQPPESVYMTIVESTKPTYSAPLTNEIKKVAGLHKGVKLIELDEVVSTCASRTSTTKTPAKFIIFVHWTHQFEMFRLSTFLAINQQVPNSRFYLYGLRPEKLYPEPSEKLTGAVTPFWHEGTTIYMSWGLARDHPEQVFRILAYAEANRGTRLLVPSDFIDIFFESWAKKASAITWNMEIYAEKVVENASVEMGVAHIGMIINEDKNRPDYQKVMNSIPLLVWADEWNQQPPVFAQQYQLEMFDLHLLNSPLATAKRFIYVDSTPVNSRLELQFPHVEIYTPATIEKVSPRLRESKTHEEFVQFVDSHTKATQKPKMGPPSGAARGRKVKK